MNRKLTRFADKLELFGIVLLLFAARRADGGLAFWLAPALCGTALCLLGLGLAWLCSGNGLAFRRRAFGKPAPAPAAVTEKLIPFPKAG